jgi:hypothetical protein
MSVDWKNAFALKDPELTKRTPEDEELIWKLARGLNRKKLIEPALFFFESMKPLSYIGSQALHFINPVAGVIFNKIDLERIARLLENRDNLTYFMDVLDEIASGGDNLNGQPNARTGKD